MCHRSRPWTRPDVAEFGPFVRYVDHRIYGLVAHYGWGPHQREMLLGTRPWTQNQNAVSIVACLRERGIQVARDQTGIARIHMDSLPPDDTMLPTLLAQWSIDIPRVSVLSLEGPVQLWGGVPIFRACVFGRTERADGARRDGLHHGAWIVGRMDVRRTYRMAWPHAEQAGLSVRLGILWSQPGEPVTRLGGVRETAMRARNTASQIARALPDWEEYLAWKSAWDKAVYAEQVARLAHMEDEDEGLLDVML